MKTKVNILIITMICANATMTWAQTFYDSKANLAGVSGNFKELVQGGYNDRYFDNDINIKEPMLMTGTKKKRQYDMNAMTRSLNGSQVGKRVLDYLFMKDEKGRLSEARLKERAVKNIQFNDVERAKVGVIDPNTILQEDYIGILENNYIVFLQRELNRTIWSVFHVDIDEKTLGDVFAAWDNPTRYNAIKVNVSPVASGNTKDDKQGLIGILFRLYTFSHNALKVKVNAPLRKIGKKVPALAIRGPVYQEKPIMVDIGAQYGVRNGDRLFIYRQHQNKDGRYRSKKIAEARAANVTDTTISIHPFSGLQPSYKKGDIACLHPDRGVRSHFTVGMSKDMYNYTYLFDVLTSVSKGGISKRLLLSVSYSNFKKENNSLFLTDPKRNTIVKAPTFLCLGMGRGYEFTLFNNLLIMPYWVISADQMSFGNDEGTKKGEGNWSFEFTAGVRATVKLVGMLNLTGGIAYTGLLFDLTKANKKEPTISQVKELIYEPAGWRRYDLQLMGGLCISF